MVICTGKITVPIKHECEVTKPFSGPVPSPSSRLERESAGLIRHIRYQSWLKAAGRVALTSVGVRKAHWISCKKDCRTDGVPNTAALQMDTHSPLIQQDAFEGADSYFPQSPDLFNDSETYIREDALPGPAIFSTNEGDQMLESSESGCSFQGPVICTPMRTKRKRKAILKPLSPSDNATKGRKLTVQEIVRNHFQTKKRKRLETRSHRKRKYVPLQKRPPTNHQERKRRLSHRRIKFPFTDTKELTLEKYLAYEQSIIGGFLHHVETVKYEHHLQESLKNMDAGEDFVREGLQIRKYKYLDDDGSISPISEPDENANGDQEEVEEHDAKIVENDHFILSCKVPSKKKWQIRKKIPKIAKQPQPDFED
ncbi:TATA box-binding protein-associated factor RNA polymerase I subunit D [Pelodytes ibericus]